jgi:hypothetical protein
MCKAAFAYITAKQAARILKCEPSHVYKLARSGVFSRYYIGVRSYRLNKVEVLRFPLRKVVR